MSNIRNYKWFNRFKKLCNIKQAAILSIILARDFLEISEEIKFLNEKKFLSLSIKDNSRSKDINQVFLLEKNIVKILENENVAYDIGSYRSAPPGLRIWGGPTINPKDIKLLLPWLQWAFEDTYKLVKKGN